MDIPKYLAENKLSQAEFGKLLGVTQGMVWQWLEGKARITAERAVEIEIATGGAVKRSELRPDVFGKAAA